MRDFLTNHKASKQLRNYFRHSIEKRSITLYKVTLYLYSLWIKSKSQTIQTEALEQCFYVVLFVMFFNVGL